MSIVSEATLQVYLGQTSLDGPAATLLTLLHGRAERLVKTFLGYAVEQASHTEFLPAHGPTVPQPELLTEDDTMFLAAESRTKLFLSELPVRSITSIYERADGYGTDARFTSTYLLTANEDYWLDVGRTGISKTGIVHRLGGSWPLAGRSVKVTYTAGYTDAELQDTDIPLAVIQAVAAAWNQAGALQGSEVAEGFGAITGESTGPHNITYDATSVREIAGLLRELPLGIQKMLWPYRRIDAV